jgi:hypothetical protein
MPRSREASDLSEMSANAYADRARAELNGRKTDGSSPNLNEARPKTERGFSCGGGNGTVTSKESGHASGTGTTVVLSINGQVQTAERRTVQCKCSTKF